MPPSIDYSISPTGGVIILRLALSAGLDAGSSVITLQRYTGALTNSPVTLFSGLAIPLFIDDGELASNHLDFNTNYFYTITDSKGSYTTPAIMPSASLVVTSSYLDRLLFRLFTAGIQALALPAGITPAGSTAGREVRVLQQMPLSRGNDLPFIVMNLDLEQQAEVAIGRAINTSVTNTWTIPTLVFRRYAFWILTRSAQDRDFYKDASISVLLTIMTNVLSEIGSNVQYSFQAAQSQVSESSPEFSPGFYEANVTIDITGMFNVAITTNYPLVSSVAPAVSSAAPGMTTIIDLF